MSMIDTLNYYIEQAEADLEGLSWDIREETNYNVHVDPTLDIHTNLTILVKVLFH